MVVGSFGGDEVGAVVLDIGSSTTRAGHAGEDSPRIVIPSAVGSLAEGDSKEKKYFGESQLYAWKKDMELKQPLENGLVKDWDAFESVWDYSISSRLRASHSEHPLMMIEPAYNPREIREKMIELAFEKFDCPAFYLGRSPVLAALVTTILL
ncbi:NuA4 histone acetyltransferase subunit [Phlyctochytrium planicorne]|nr:NuA4 histone acetyltransferase subunit [Phlyctochytrium planicorne]